jgi:acyl carrier protein
MNENEVRQTALSVLTSIAPEIADVALRNDQPLRRQVDLDSMDWLNFLLGLHERLGVDIPETDYARLTTLDEIAKYLLAKLP